MAICAMCIMTDQHIWNKMRLSIVIRWTSTNWFIKMSLSIPFRNLESHCYTECHISSCWLIKNHHIWLNHYDGTFFERKMTEIGIGRKAHGLHIKCDKYSLRLCINQQQRIAIENVFCLLWLIQYLITVKQINLLFLINHSNVCATHIDLVRTFRLIQMDWYQLMLISLL